MFNLFEKIHKGDQKVLECKHMFHSSCIMHWALETSCKTGMVEFQRPITNRRIHLFKQGENICTCPCCRIEYTHDVVSHDSKRVLAKAHVANKGKYLVHYISLMRLKRWHTFHCQKLQMTAI